jgi:hypothetical protein
MTDPGVQAIDAAGKRPIAVTVICIISWIGSAFAVPLLFSDTARAIAPWYPPFLGVSALIGIVCTIGLWMMRKWGVYAYIALAAINQVILAMTGLWNPLALLIPAIVIVVMLIYLSRMR